MQTVLRTNGENSDSSQATMHNRQYLVLQYVNVRVVYRSYESYTCRRVLREQSIPNSYSTQVILVPATCTVLRTTAYSCALYRQKVLVRSTLPVVPGT